MGCLDEYTILRATVGVVVLGSWGGCVGYNA